MTRSVNPFDFDAQDDEPRQRPRRRRDEDSDDRTPPENAWSLRTYLLIWLLTFAAIGVLSLGVVVTYSYNALVSKQQMVQQRVTNLLELERDAINIIDEGNLMPGGFTRNHYDRLVAIIQQVQTELKPFGNSPRKIPPYNPWPDRHRD